MAVRRGNIDLLQFLNTVVYAIKANGDLEAISQQWRHLPLGESAAAVTATVELITTRGLRMPRLGLGTGLLRNAPGQASMELALSLGFRHLDTAEMYTNEGTVGAAIAASGVPRGDIHITTKMLPEHMEPTELRRSMERSLAALKHRLCRSVPDPLAHAGYGSGADARQR